VEKLVKTRVRSGIQKILVRWEGNYPDSWESEQNISDHLTNEFYTINSNQNRKGKEKKIHMFIFVFSLTSSYRAN
jgi:hypothetical protein